MNAVAKLGERLSFTEDTVLPNFNERACRHLHNQIFDVEVNKNGKWVPNGKVGVLPNVAFHDQRCLHNLAYHKATNSLVYGANEGVGRNAGRLHFSDNGRAFVGTMSDADGQPLAVRGVRGYDEIFDTQRKKTGEDNGKFSAWDNLEIKSEWVDHELGTPELVISYFLGGKNVSNRVRATKVNRAKGTTVLEMVASLLPGGGTDSFDITLAFGNKSFSGTYTAEDGTEYSWKGTLEENSGNALSHGIQETAAKVLPMNATLTRNVLAASIESTSTLSMQDLDNVSSIIAVTNNKGQEFTVDQAQTTAGSYYNKCLVNGLDDNWVNKLFGHKYLMPEGVQAIFEENKDFFQNNSVLATGQMLYDNFSTDPSHKSAIDKIKPKVMKTAWTNLGTNKEGASSYQDITNDMYIQGYKDGVAGIKPYTDDGVDWGKKYYDYLTDESNLLTWQIQIASKEFGNIKGRMYEWYTKLSVLSPNKSYAKDMLATAYSALLGVAYNKIEWSDDIKPYIEAVIKQAQDGSADFLNDMQKQSVEEMQEILRSMISASDTMTGLVDAIASALTTKANKTPGRPMSALISDADFVDEVGRALPESNWSAWSELGNKERVGGALSGVGYLAAAGYLIYTIADSKDHKLSPKEIAEEINMGILAMGLFVKGVQKIMTLGVGRALEGWAAAGQSGFRDFAANIAKWFSKEGKVVPEGALGKAFVKIFGENYTEFFARRLGPVLAVFGVVLSAIFLVDAIKSGDTRDIVFESLNTFFALADVVFIGLELMSFAWAGPVGLAVAAVGVVVMVVQLVWNLMDPPAPPPDPIQEFVDGPMKTAGFAS